MAGENTQITPPISTENPAPGAVQPGPQGGNSGGSGDLPTANQLTEMFEVKVNGKAIKMTKQEMMDRASLAEAAQQKFEEASKIRKKYESREEIYKKNRMQAFLDATADMTPEKRRETLESYYSENYIEADAMSEEQKQIKAYKAKLAKYEQEEKEKLELAEKTEAEKQTTEQRQHLQTQIIEAIDKSGLPKSKEVVKKIAFYMRQNLMNGWDAPMDLIIRQVKNERQSTYRDDLENSTAEQIIEIFGEGLITKIRQYDLKQLRDRRQNGGFQQTVRKAGTGAMPEEKTSYADVNKKLRDMRAGKF